MDETVVILQIIAVGKKTGRAYIHFVRRGPLAEAERAIVRSLYQEEGPAKAVFSFEGASRNATLMVGLEGVVCPLVLGDDFDSREGGIELRPLAFAKFEEMQAAKQQRASRLRELK
uniref:Uncharacterized protein n=1 Tax=Chromera velia CCMP2878 TaxID=1169474 RepID=A0A0G4HH33_9ALVE|eukprot:Cvel_27533.t1-p1 / transcript=Cvel_27533.t1 / gene=Cvel_27533 / organism=Chromera_velia_CCMP2878 / gene_product=hypothetical protein / transcript_product=hypothetical protein / location=Cvel_scaffold3453:10803-11147(+) / protein_length=115 / sequence_SO=supercontig / SO=protein_coding / is_pseudo=false